MHQNLIWAFDGRGHPHGRYRKASKTQEGDEWAPSPNPKSHHSLDSSSVHGPWRIRLHSHPDRTSMRLHTHLGEELSVDVADVLGVRSSADDGSHGELLGPEPLSAAPRVRD